MSRADQVIEFVRENPGVTADEICRHFKQDLKWVLTKDLKSESPKLTRELYKNYNGSPRYRWYVTGSNVPQTEDEVAVSISPPKEPSPPPQRASLVDALRELSSTLALRIAEQIVSELEPILANRVHVLTESLSATPEVLPVQVDNDKKRKVLVVGCYNGQIAELKREFGQCFKLTFYTSDENLHQLQAKARNADKIFVMQRFISHRHVESIKAARVEYTLVDGAVSALRDALTALYVGEAA